ncbi:MAG: pyrimidine reductase family protein [Acidimicrobiales bacterium]
MRQILPTAAEVDVATAHAEASRPSPRHRPWLMLNVVSSVDGATAVGGVSGPLGSAADRAVFSALRAVADVVLAGAGTVRAERYRPPQTSDHHQSQRQARGQRTKPRVAVVSVSLDLDIELDLFGDPQERPLVITTSDAPADRLARLGEVSDLILAGTGRVDLSAALTTLSEHGSVVLCEGGSSLNGQLLALDLVDEVNLTLSPVMAGGTSPRLAAAPVEVLRPLTLAHLWEAEGMLLARYIMDRDHP